LDVGPRKTRLIVVANGRDFSADVAIQANNVATLFDLFINERMFSLELPYLVILFTLDIEREEREIETQYEEQENNGRSHLCEFQRSDNAREKDLRHRRRERSKQHL
jgi:hypothetical protein